MNQRRGATSTIWKTVVFAGAMLGSAACSKKTPAPVAPTEETATDNANPCAEATEPNPCEAAVDPCADNPCRERGNPCEGEGETGRGFILS